MAGPKRSAPKSRKSSPRQSRKALARQASRQQSRDAAGKRWSSRIRAEQIRLRAILPARLSEIVGEDIGEFERTAGVPHGTLQGWIQRGKGYSSLPSLEGLSVVAGARNVTLDWLVGRAAKDPAVELPQRLADHIAQVLSNELSIRVEFVAAAMPTPSSLLETIVGQCRSNIEAVAREKIDFDDHRRMRRELAILRSAQTAREKGALPIAFSPEWEPADDTEVDSGSRPDSIPVMDYIRSLKSQAAPLFARPAGQRQLAALPSPLTEVEMDGRDAAREEQYKSGFAEMLKKLGISPSNFGLSGVGVVKDEE